MKGLEDVTRELIELFESESIPYAIMGGLAVRIYAIPRPTFDVDFTILLPRADLPQFYLRAESLGYTVSAAQAAGWVDSVKGLSVVKIQAYVGDRAIDVDIFLAETEFQRHLLTRRQRHEAEGLDAWFVSPEDLILLKLLAGRPKDRLDIADIVFIQGALDEAYLRDWATRLDVLPALEESLRPLDESR